MPTRKPTPPPPREPPWPKHMAIRRLKQALEKIPELQGLNHEDEKFQAWHEDLKRVLQINWPQEPRLPDFRSMVISVTPFRGGPGPRIRPVDLEAYRNGLTATKTRLEVILRNEQELAEAIGDTSVTELFLPPGSQYDAYSFIRKIISEAALEIFIEDNYVDSTILTLLTNVTSGVVVSILTYHVPKDFKLECEKFTKQHRLLLEVRLRSVDFHDRFIIVDGDKAYHLGASIKDAGEKASMIHLIQDAENVKALKGTYNASWTAARPL